MIQKQRGVTLIELMISMMLGLSLVAGISQLFIQSQKSFSMQRNLSDMTDDGSFVLEILAKGLLQAGFAEDGDTSGTDGSSFQVDATPFSGTTVSLAKGEYLNGTDNEIIYRYKLSSIDELDNFICTSTSSFNAAVGDMVTVRIYVKDDTKNIPVLYCKVKSPTSTPSAEPLISEVYKLIIKYGVRVDTGGIYYADKAGVGVDGWKKVVAIKLFLVVRSADDNLTHNKTTYEIEGVKQPVVPDKRLYKVFSKTVYLRAPDH
jgi:prepilin-type N-terminal cleavage/methylation domain-containing protein